MSQTQQLPQVNEGDPENQDMEEGIIQEEGQNPNEVEGGEINSNQIEEQENQMQDPNNEMDPNNEGGEQDGQEVAQI
jgi:hypothetical protein